MMLGAAVGRSMHHVRQPDMTDSIFLAEVRSLEHFNLSVQINVQTTFLTQVVERTHSGGVAIPAMKGALDGDCNPDGLEKRVTNA